jgi:hypothetical protein
MHRRTFLAAIPATLLTPGLSGGYLRAAEFVTGFEDVPAMPGMTVDGGSATSFDTPTGRIVEAYAAGDMSPDAVEQFYQDALPQLGWTRTGVLEFQREGEKLTVELVDWGSPITVRFRLAPHAKP